MYVCEKQTRRILAVNDAAVALYGYSAEALCEMTSYDLRPSEEQERLRTWVEERSAQSGFSDAGVWTHVRRDGSLLRVRLITIGPLSEQGDDAELVAVFDVTERERERESFYAHKVALEEVERLGDVGTIMVDRRTGTCRLTGFLTRAFGRSSLTLDEYCERAPATIDPGNAAEGARLIAATRELQPYDGTLRVLVGGEPRWVHVRRAIVRDDDGTAVGVVGMSRDVTDRMDEAERLRALAFRDAETGLLTWAGLVDGLGDEARLGAVMMVKFSWIASAAERLPEARGTLVRTLAERLSALVGPGREIARYGRETFAVVLRAKGRVTTPTGLAERVAAAFLRPVPSGERDFVVVPAIGICTLFDPRHRLSDLTARAEAALKEAEGSPDRIAVYCDALEQTHDRRAAIQQHLRFAIAERAVSVAYQPLVAIPSGTIVGAEALMRWNCPGIGPVPPAEFITAAEESGGILALGEWILREACAQARRWQIRGLPPIRMTVNVSALQVQQPDFLRVVTSACEATNLHPSCLELEITERVMLGRDGCTLRTLEALRRLGVRIAVDDFGTGYSSLSTFATLPLDTLKLDQSFVAGIADDAFQADLVESMIKLAHRRGLVVVGEGVETPRQAHELRRMDCDEAQGFLFAAPMSADDFSVLLAAGCAAEEPDGRGDDLLCVS